jgi:hypothetical protein
VSVLEHLQNDRPTAQRSIRLANLHADAITAQKARLEALLERITSRRRPPCSKNI